MGFVEELRWRGMLHDMMPGTEEQLNKEMTAGYIGFDPTADSLHIGNLVPVMLLVHFQRAGHKPIVLVGGATGMVGDPSGKSEERKLLSEDILQHNVACQQKQLAKFLDFEHPENGAEMVNNYDWFKDMSFLDFLRNVGKHLTVNYMMAKDSVQKRIETGISFTEFSYQLVQGYDFYHLNKHHQCRLQMGGSDQWGNITTGTELIRRMGGSEAYALTSPLITKADGGKFGKSEGGNVWLDANRTSPYKFYQFWLNTSDEDAKRYIRIFTLLSKEEIEQLEAEHDENPGFRALQKALAKDVTIRIHSEEEYNKAIEASAILFGKNTTDQLKQMDEALLLSVLEGVPTATVPKSLIEGGVNIIELLSDHATVFPSRGEARRKMKDGAVSINKEKIHDPETNIDASQLLNNKHLLVQNGKKNYFLVSIAQ